jgi:hypothetical protein
MGYFLTAIFSFIIGIGVGAYLNDHMDENGNWVYDKDIQDIDNFKSN